MCSEATHEVFVIRQFFFTTIPGTTLDELVFSISKAHIHFNWNLSHSEHQKRGASNSLSSNPHDE
jgi:hypothetical protein